MARLNRFCSIKRLSRSEVALRAIQEYLDSHNVTLKSLEQHYAITHADGTVDMHSASTSLMNTIFRGDGKTICVFDGLPDPNNYHLVKHAASRDWFDFVALVYVIVTTFKLHTTPSDDPFRRIIADPYIPHILSMDTTKPTPIQDKWLDDIAFSFTRKRLAASDRACHLWLAWKNVNDFYRRDDDLGLSMLQDTIRHCHAATSAKPFQVEELPTFQWSDALHKMPSTIEYLREKYYGPAVEDSDEITKRDYRVFAASLRTRQLYRKRSGVVPLKD